jgi:beta-lactamase class C
MNTKRMAPIVLGLALLAGGHAAFATSDETVADIVTRQVLAELPEGWQGAVAVAVRLEGRTLFFNFGYADIASKRPATTDTLFNLGSVGKVFDAALLAQAATQGELSLDDPVTKYITELNDGGDIRRITLGELASHSSGFVLPQDHEPWPEQTFTLPEFIATLRQWKMDAGHRPGGQMIYAHSGYVLLHLVLERRFGVPFHELMSERILKPLGLDATTLPLPVADTQTYPRGRIPPDLEQRAVQGYDQDGQPIGKPGNLQGYYHWLGTGQMYSSARDMAVLLAANLNEMADHRALQDAMQLTHHPILPINTRVQQAMAWEFQPAEPQLVDKYGGLNNASAFIAMLPSRKIGIVLLGNRGSLGVATAGRAILQELAAP